MEADFHLFVMDKPETTFSRQAAIDDTTIGWRLPHRQMQHLYGVEGIAMVIERV